MLLSATLLFVAQVTSAPSSSNLSAKDELSVAYGVWETCVEMMAKDYSKQPEAANVVADAAVAACQFKNGFYREVVEKALVAEGMGGAMALERAPAIIKSHEDRIRAHALKTVFEARRK